MTRRFRLGVSVFFAVLTVLLCGLWVQSYWLHNFAIRIYKNDVVDIGSNSGSLYVAQYRTLPPDEAWRHPVWCFQSTPADPNRNIWYRSADSKSVGLPYWCVTPLFALATFAAIRWNAWRFSLRTLFIATTLIAMLLGLIMWLAL
jgi:hypothetical protein